VTSPAARFAGALAMLAMFVGVEAMVFSLRGLSPATFTAALLGAFLGLISLAIEIGMQERSARIFHAQGMQTTFMSFMMRMVIVAPLTLLFMKKELGVDHEAFALSYCSTFFLYMCWLTWETYHAPALYRPKAAAAGPLVVRDRRRAPAGSAA
jgi:FlaA1/EpsC-like NDP-sugar epimerase